VLNVAFFANWLSCLVNCIIDVYASSYLLLLGAGLCKEEGLCILNDIDTTDLRPMNNLGHKNKAKITNFCF